MDAHSAATVTIITGALVALCAGSIAVQEKLRSKLPIASGLELLLVGAIAGPLGVGLPGLNQPQNLAPFAAILATWVGLRRGGELYLRNLSDAQRGGTRLGVFVGLGAAGLVFVGARFFFGQGPWAEAPPSAWMHAAWLACAAASSALMPITIAEKHHEGAGRVLVMIRRGAIFADVFALLLFGVVFCVFREDDTVFGRPLSAMEWSVVSIVCGTLLGFLFTPFMGKADKLSERLVSLVAVTAITSGLVLHFDLSPLWVSLATGAVVINTLSAPEPLRETLSAGDTIMRPLLLLFAGLLWTPPDPVPAVVACLGYLLLRSLGSQFGAWIASRTVALSPKLGRGLLGQDEVALAIAIMLRVGFRGPSVDLIYSTIIVSVALHQVVAPLVIKGLLVSPAQAVKK